MELVAHGGRGKKKQKQNENFKLLYFLVLQICTFKGAVDCVGLVHVEILAISCHKRAKKIMRYAKRRRYSKFAHKPAFDFWNLKFGILDWSSFCDCVWVLSFEAWDESSI